ncbi:MAG: hypothetical protein ABIO82_03705 [Ginsengibacter sp.]
MSCPTKKINKIALEQGSIGYWELSGGIMERSGNNLNTVRPGPLQLNAEGPNVKKNSATGFDGRSAWMEIPANPKTQLGTEDFSVATWI